MSSPVRIDLNIDQIQAMKEGLIATLTPAHIEELCTLRTDAKLAAESFSEAIKAHRRARELGLNWGQRRRLIPQRAKIVVSEPEATHA